MIMMRDLLSILLLLLFQGYNGFTQVFEGGHHNFQSYSIDFGLPQSTVYDMLQDERGYIWAGTEGGGLSRFDGTNFTT
ncbi:MAG: hypothetical protein IH946_04195, partial [Bacteroidetes bacterium]|nr:hypothetical protein [Bacteroidota bacterium]